MPWSPDYLTPEQRARLTRKQHRDRRIEKSISIVVLAGFVVVFGGGLLSAYVLPSLRSLF
jgi:hypothetical protein